MRTSGWTHGLRLAAILCLLPGCGGQAQDDSAPGAAITPATETAATPVPGGIDPAYFAGDFQMKLSRDVPIRGTPVPFTVFAGLEEAGPTRLRLRAFVDMRELQDKVPEILNGPLEDSCNRQILLDIRDVSARGDIVRVEGAAEARFTRCTRAGATGFRYFSATVDAVATGRAEVVDQCLTFSIEGIELRPRGVLGALSNVLGVTNRVSTALLERGGTLLAEHPVCPPLPAEFAMLDPDYEAGGTREISPGGMGAAVEASIDVSSRTIITLLAELQQRGVIGAGR